MNNDLISREAAVQLLRDKASGYTVSMFLTSSDCNLARVVATECAVDIKNIPAVDAEPVRHGRWIVDIKRLKASCSECGKILQFSNEMQISLLRDEERFCYYCGAKMDLE